MPEKAIDLSEKTYREPVRIFEGSGFVNPDESYYVPLENVTNRNKQDLKTMVDRGRYFSIFAPRQSGKTTFLTETCRQLQEDPTYVAIILSFQDNKDLSKKRFYESIERDLYTQLIDRLKEVGCEKTETVKGFLDRHHLIDNISFRILFEELNRILLLKKIVIFIDEFDGIPRIELENFLTTLRDLYQKHKKVTHKALYSIGLVGIRNITKLIVGGVSPFNIADHVELPPFSLKNVQELYAQYTEETNQPFTPLAIRKVYEETAGQTWLVNRLGAVLTMDVKPGTIDPIDEMDVEKAIQILLYEKNDHFDNLYEKAVLYKETFLEIVFDNVKYRTGNEDQGWLEQYGLIKKKEDKAIVANNIYKRRFTETFFDEAEIDDNIAAKQSVLPGGILDMDNILLEFAGYISQIGARAFYTGGKPYEKTGQFLLTAWLYQFVKGGQGDLRYEMVSGLGRMDVILTYQGKKYIIETKVNRFDDVDRVIDKGVVQLSGKYLASEGVNEGYLVVFDTRTPVGAICEPKIHPVGDKQVTSFTIAIGSSSPSTWI